MICTFYNVLDDERKINKTLTNSHQTTCDIINATNIINPSIIVDSAYINYNYVYINDLHRYYFVDNVAISNNMIVIQLRIDVLYTYKDIIKITPMHILRCEDYRFTDRFDDKIIMTAKTIQESYKISDNLITNNVNYLLGVR